jgi:hypothetical protein
LIEFNAAFAAFLMLPNYRLQLMARLFLVERPQLSRSVSPAMPGTMRTDERFDILLRRVM